MRPARLLVWSVILLTGVPAPREPLTARFSDSAAYRWLHKKVLSSRSLDRMESLDTWHTYSTGGEEVVDARVNFKRKETSASVASIALSKSRTHEGNYSLWMRTPTKTPGPGPKSGRGWGRSGIRRYFEGEDWRKYNRISIWIYPRLPGFYTTALDFRLYNEGEVKLPAAFGQEGETSLVLRNNEWNHVVWEISNVARDRITSFEISYGLSGNMPEEADSIDFYFDQLDLELVNPDKIEGWDVWPGRIAFCHTGYQAGAEKTAIANGIRDTSFRLVDQETGEVALTGPVESVSTSIGRFQVLDFSSQRRPGLYVLESGNIRTQPFRISDHIWERTIWKALNFFYMERCGYAVPGVHSICHRDWTCVHGGKRICINGGWHDAGDLTQGLENTGEITYALFSLADKLQQQGANLKLYDRVMEEAEWGLDWVLKTSFGDGYRNAGSINSRRTDNIIGDDDDITATARNSPMTNFEAAAVEALAGRLLRKSKTRLANYALRMAEADWQFAVLGLPGMKWNGQLWRGTFDSDGVEHELAVQAILASVNLWKATGKREYAEEAFRMARLITGSQQRRNTDWDVPLSGFYYTDTARDRILHYCHRGREQGPTLALAALCEAFPQNPDWMRWYSAISLYAEYLKKISVYTRPYGVLPASVYVDTEYLNVPQSRKASFRRQVLQGIPLGQGHYLRLFPVWLDYRGHFGTILPQAQALARAAQMRDDWSGAQLATRQLQWIIGRNPFSQSAMWGEGYDYPPLYSPSSGDMVGGLPVGIQTRGDSDVPYWPVQSTWTYKEIWVHPVTNWIWLLKDLAGPAIAQGMADSTVVFTDIGGGQQWKVDPDPVSGQFRVGLPEGRYSISSRNAREKRTFLPGGIYNLDLKGTKRLQWTLTANENKRGEVWVRVVLTGYGRHHFDLRTDNLIPLDGRRREVNAGARSTTITWKAKVEDVKSNWIALVVPDDRIQERKEVNDFASAGE